MSEDEEVFVYVMAKREGAEIKAPVKVGVSSGARGRLATIQTACPFDLELVREFRFPSRQIALDVEDCFHKTQAKHQLRGEWFDLAPSYAIAIINLHVCLMLKFFTSLSADDRVIAAEMCGVDRPDLVA
jgi:hypothetical protein